MKKYSKYKKTNIDWIGELPEHWSYSKLKWKSTIYAGGTPSTSEPSYWEGGDIPWLNSGSVNQKIITEPSEYITKKGLEESSTKMVKTGSLLMALAGQGKTKGTVAITEIDTTCNQSLGVIDTGINIVSKYEFYYLESKYKQIRGLAGDSKRDGLNLSILGDIFTPLPPKKEQTAIATYLDHKTALIDKLIASNEKQIKLLEEKRKATINQAVTKGLDPNVRMKDSGVEWIGEIPEHWEVSKLSYLAKTGSGTTPKSGDSRYYQDGTHNWLITGDLKSKYIKDTSKKITSLAFKDYSALKEYNKGSIIIAMYGATIGAISILAIETTVNQACAVIEFQEGKIDTLFGYYFMRANKDNLLRDSVGGGQPNVSQEIIKNQKVVIPRINEQLEIIEYLESFNQEVDDLSKKLKQQNKLLKEYRQSLISHVVTGKVDVRDEVKMLKTINA